MFVVVKNYCPIIGYILGDIAYILYFSLFSRKFLNTQLPIISLQGCNYRDHGRICAIGVGCLRGAKRKYIYCATS